MHNNVLWRGALPLPIPMVPAESWLLPSTDEAAMWIASYALGLHAAGWRLLTADAALVSKLGNKATLRAHAEALGILHVLPTHYASAKSATYPCILKVATGEYGRGTHIVQRAAEVRHLAPAGLGADWVLQELIVGRREMATSLLVKDGVVLDCICTTYEYACESYVWPRVGEVRARRQHSREVPARHADTMRHLLQGFSGICNFNYKVDATSGHMKIFEINTRAGADLACDVPAAMLRQFFAKLDAC